MQNYSEGVTAGYEFGRLWTASPAAPSVPDQTNPLRAFFNAHRQGRGIIKWDHYFEAYDRHLSRFRGQEIHLLEIGIFSGGSLEMWREYFGPRCYIYGVDINPACKVYESERTQVFIGDQSDREFWKQFRAAVPQLHIAIDDGGHEPQQQRVSFEELMPHLRPGGVYICEDIHEPMNPFAAYVQGFSLNLNATEGAQNNPDNPERRIVCRASAVQASVSSIHLYPFLAVIERSPARLEELIAPMHGTQWQPHKQG